MAKSGTKLGPVDLSSDIPPVEASSGQEWYIGPVDLSPYVTGCCTGTLDELVGSHTKLEIYPTLTIHCQRVVICASLNTRFKGMQVVTYLANVKQLKSY